LSPFLGCCLAVIDVCAIPFVLAEFSSINEIKLLLFHYNTRANDEECFCLACSSLAFVTNSGLARS